MQLVKELFGVLFSKGREVPLEKCVCNANANFSVLERSSSHVHIYVYIFMECSLPKHDLRDWHWQLNFWIAAYRVLEKNSSFCLHMDRRSHKLLLQTRGFSHFNNTSPFTSVLSCRQIMTFQVDAIPKWLILYLNCQVLDKNIICLLSGIDIITQHQMIYGMRLPMELRISSYIISVLFN